ncbi:hypothetical protein ACJU26_08900 [Acidithiobacillus sp. M4-SHS-6]|uniref:hypothetical protein n=1 Tax=Acidithiobacillus sp. M4-SHS-6 TaxID=3383024 RepID=UPI0039BDDF25
MDKSLRDAISHILDLREQLAERKSELSEAVKAAAERFDRKPAEINRLATVIEKESQTGGVISAQQDFLTEAESYFED